MRARPGRRLAAQQRLADRFYARWLGLPARLSDFIDQESAFRIAG